MPGRDTGPSSPLGPDLKTGLVDPPRSYRVDLFTRRRARREALRQVDQLRKLIEMFDNGEVALDELAYGIGLVGARLGASACSGLLAS
jgi:hypothetical protein